MSSISIWTRLGNWLRLSQNADADDPADAIDKAKPARTTDGLTVANEPPAKSGSDRWLRRDRVLQDLKEGQDRTQDLLAAMRQQFDAGQHGLIELRQAVARLAEPLAALPRTATSHQDSLDGIGRQLDGIGRRLDQHQADQARLEEILEQVPEFTRRQSELLGLVHEDVRAGQASQNETAGAMRELRHTVDLVQDATQQGAARLDVLDHSLETKTQDLLRALEAQNRRMSQMLWTAMGLSGIAVVGSLIAVLMSLGS